MTRNRMYVAFAVYAALALAGLSVPTRDLRLALWVFLAGLALKTWVAWLKEKQDGGPG